MFRVYLNIFYQNVRRLRSKLELVRPNFPIFGKYDVEIIYEAWLTPNIHNSDLGLTNFLVYRLDKTSFTSNYSRGSGVLIATKSKFNYLPICMNFNNVEKIIILENLFSVQFFSGVVYLPSNNPVQLYESHVYSVDIIIPMYSSHSIFICYQL